MNLFDTCIITASNAAQARVFAELVKRRLDAGLYPREIDFRVYHDPDTGRVGSGGGTLLALVNLLHDHGAGADPATFFARHRVLIIHAGGESRRMPCYVPEGKLFAPLPLATSSIFPPVVLDLHLTLFLKYPWHAGEVVVISGDVVFDFDTSCIPDDRGDLCGFAKPSSAEQGSRHGVFKFDRNRGAVLDFLQKATPEYLRAHAALEGTSECALDMGIVSLSPAATAAFVNLALLRGRRTPLGATVASGKASFDLYLEILTAGLPGLPRQSYVRRMAGRTRLDRRTLDSVYAAFHAFPLHGVVTRATTFVHVGALPEYPHSCLEVHQKGLRPFYAQEHEELDAVCTPELILTNSVDFNVPAGRHSMVYAESARCATLSNAMGSNLLVGIRNWSTTMVIPEGICVDERNLNGSTVRLVYGMHDTFRAQKAVKDVVFCGIPMSDWLQTHGLVARDVWHDGEGFDLLHARLFVEDPRDEFLAGYWQRPFDTGWSDTFRSCRRHSIAEANAMTSALDRDDQRIAVRTALLQSRLKSGVGWRNIPAVDLARIAGDASVRHGLSGMLAATDDALLRAYRSRCLSELKTRRAGTAGSVSFDIDYLKDRQRGPLSVSVKQDQIVWARSPVRLDIAGGWSDTPPYTLSFGGQVCNVAVDLNGQPPIQVFCRRTREPRIRVHSIDLGVTETFTTFEQLADYRDPTSPFGLPKAALCLLGIAPERCGRGSLRACLDAVGCGLEITLLCAVPKGSGLGTSSILGATILAALQRFFGRQGGQDELFRQVLQMEQMLTTGGGWQDQIGGIAGGVKYIESGPGLRPSPVIHRLDPWLFDAAGPHAAFTLFYTGITRLAKNILQDVVAQVNSRTPAYLFTLDHIRSLAVDAREAFSLRDPERLARVIAASWEANKRIHPGTTNRDVDALLAATRPWYSGVKLLGAGGGGYALFASPDAVSAGGLRDLLRRKFEHGNSRIVDFALNREGLQVTVS